MRTILRTPIALTSKIFKPTIKFNLTSINYKLYQNNPLLITLTKPINTKVEANETLLPNNNLTPTPISKPFTLKPYMELARMDKPIGTMLLLWPCIWSIGMASYHLQSDLSTMLYTTTLFTTGAFIMRGAGCTINDLWDVKYDKKIERTKTRPIASGTLTRYQAFKFLGVQLSAGLAILLQLNNYSIVLGASSLALVVIYPLMKRVTYWPQFTLGLAFNWGALLGWSAMVGHCNWNIVLPLYCAGISWTLVYDTIYAHQDKLDDVKVGVKSTALYMGDQTKFYLSGFSAITLSMLTLSGYLNGHGVPFFLGTIIGGGSHLYWQLKTVDLNNTKQCWEKFKSNNTFGAIIAAAILADLLWLKMAEVKEEKMTEVKEEKRINNELKV
ncbi:4-hydroxybenzoate polyprenyl transferase [Neoconidiobolus thromboides FSU 785]|nr:4-hydroxybenzoate polyprenyl transferase [Neoconidiobolus thromboides FSU 785]